MLLCRCCWCHMARLVTCALVIAIKMLPPMLRAKLIRPATWLLSSFGMPTYAALVIEIKQNGSGSIWTTRSHEALRKAHLQRGHIGRVAEREHEQRESAYCQRPRGNFARGNARQRHHDHQRNAARRQRQPRRGGVVAQQFLHKLRLQHGVRVQHAAHQHHQEATDREILEAE